MIRRLVLLVALTPLVALAQSATTYVVQPGDTLYRMEAGDTLIFDADAPHGPEDLVRLPIRYLSVITYPQNR